MLPEHFIVDFHDGHVDGVRPFPAPLPCLREQLPQRPLVDSTVLRGSL